MASEKNVQTKPKKKGEKDNVIIRVCDPCRLENTHSVADGYCKVCREYVCQKCEKFHRRFQATRSHKIVHGVLMPKPVKKSMTTCEYHVNNAVEFYCKEHMDVVCGYCKDTNHAHCKGVLPLDVFCSKTISEEERESISNDLKHLLAEFQKALERRKQDKEDLDKQKLACHAEINSFREEFNTLLDKLQAEFSKEVDDLHTDEHNVVTDQINVIDVALESLQKAIVNIAEVKKTENNMAEFTSITKGNKAIYEFNKVLKDIKREAYAVDLSIDLDKVATEFLTALVALGTAKKDVIPTTFPTKLNELKSEYIQVVDSKVYSVRMDGDDSEQDCEITGSIFLDDGSLAICDKHNSKVKLLDSNFNCRYDIVMESAPWDVARVNEKWLVVSLPFTKRLQFLHPDIDEGMHLGRFIKTERMCWGVTVANEDIIITCHDNPGNGNIHIIDKRGHLKKIIGAEAEGTSFMFELPFYITANAAGDKLFVADGDIKRTITCLATKGGQIIYDYSVSEFGYSKQSTANTYQSPWSFRIIVDEDDHVFANLGDTELIQIVTDTGLKYRTLLATKEALSGPHTLSYREKDATLIISLWDQIQTFRFKEIEEPSI